MYLVVTWRRSQFRRGNGREQQNRGFMFSDFSLALTLPTHVLVRLCLIATLHGRKRASRGRPTILFARWCCPNQALSEQNPLPK